MKFFQLGPNDAQQRLDKFLKKLLKNASLSYIYKLNRKGNIKVNKKKQKNEYILEIWDELRIFVSDEEYNTLTKSKKENITKKIWSCFKQSDIIYEDNQLLVINKEAGLIVHPGDHKNKDVSLIEQVHDYYQWKDWWHTFSASLVHRIDKDTSGIILIAKDKKLLSQLVSDFKNHKNIQKKYRCFVTAKLSRKNWTIKKKILRLENVKNENKIQISPKWQEAITHFRLIKEYPFRTEKENIVVSELEVEIETGRMHQIRIHLADLWHPIVGDKTYGNKKLNSYFSRHFKTNRQLLHASSIQVYNETSKKSMLFHAPYKNDFKQFIKKLGS